MLPVASILKNIVLPGKTGTETWGVSENYPLTFILNSVKTVTKLKLNISQQT